MQPIDRMDVYWLEQTEADVPAAGEWLAIGETISLSRLRFPKRRADWRLGRWTAKRAVAAYLREPADLRALSRIEIRAAPSGAPEAFAGDLPAPVTVSLSHREGVALCAVGPPGAALGCDLEIVEPRCAAFAAEYFTEEEQAAIRQAAGNTDRYRLLALLWSAKESVLKALGEGLRLDPRDVRITAPATGCDPEVWNSFQARHANRAFGGWWRQNGPLIRTLAADPAPGLPVHLHGGGWLTSVAGVGRS